MVKGVNGKQKGAAFERKILKEFETWTGVRWQRTLLSGGGKEKADIAVVDGYTPFLVELKNRETFTYHQFFSYSERKPIWVWWAKLLKEQEYMAQNTSKKPILLIAKANRKPVMLICDAEAVALLDVQKYPDVKFQCTLRLKTDEVVYMFLWDEIKDKVNVKRLFKSA